MPDLTVTQMPPFVMADFLRASWAYAVAHPYVIGGVGLVIYVAVLIGVLARIEARQRDERALDAFIEREKRLAERQDSERRAATIHRLVRGGKEVA